MRARACVRIRGLCLFSFDVLIVVLVGCMFTRVHQVSDSTKIDKLEAELKKDLKALDAAKAPASAIEAEIKAIEEAIANVGGVMLKAQKSKVKSLNNAMDKLRSNITKVTDFGGHTLVFFFFALLCLTFYACILVLLRR